MKCVKTVGLQAFSEKQSKDCIIKRADALASARFELRVFFVLFVC